MVDQTELKRDEYERRGKPALAQQLSAAGAKVVAGNGGVIETPARQPMIASLRSMQDRSNGNWDMLIESIGTFIIDQRALLDSLERWLGTK